MSKFEKMYNELYKKHKKQLEKGRRKIILIDILFVVAMVVIVKEILNLIQKMQTDTNAITVMLILFFVAIGLYVVLRDVYKKKYIKSYKTNIISNIAKLVDENLEYKMMNTNDFNIQNNYLAAEFDNKRFDTLYVDDCIEGTLKKDIHVKICDICIQKEREFDKYHTHKKKLLKGIFAMVTSSNNLGTTIKITRNKLKILDSKERVQMDSSEFEKYFDVYAEDKIMAMRILTSDFMECLIDFLYKYDLVFEIVFKNNMIYLRFFTGPMFEPKIIGSVMDEWDIYTYYHILKFIIDITQTVNASKKDLDI